MKREFTKLLGTRIYLELPEVKDHGIIMDEATKAAVEKEQIEAFARLRVYAIGDSVTTVKVGDEVMIDPRETRAITRIDLNKKKAVVLVSEMNIAHIW